MSDINDARAALLSKCPHGMYEYMVDNSTNPPTLLRTECSLCIREERDALRARLEAQAPVVEAAVAWLSCTSAHIMCPASPAGYRMHHAAGECGRAEELARAVGRYEEPGYA